MNRPVSVDLEYADILKAAKRIRPHIHRTPVLSNQAINQLAGCEIFFKCENFQKVGAFKARGALNAVMSLDRADMQKGVATHSSGNHAAALALAARINGIKAYIVMPENSPEIKKKAVIGYGANVTWCQSNLKSREETLQKVVAETGAVFIPPYNHEKIIAGQGTAALELLEEISELDTVIVPIGGGGLAGGTGIAVKHSLANCRLIAAEPDGADDAFQSFTQKRFIPVSNPVTVADGLRTSLGDKTFGLLIKNYNHVVTVPDNLIIDAMRTVWERMKIVIEPSSAVPLAVALSGKLDIKGQKVGIILSGGNVDLDHLPWNRLK